MLWNAVELSFLFTEKSQLNTVSNNRKPGENYMIWIEPILQSVVNSHQILI